jgi:RNA polymerase sigma-70 factor (ECF subfamily)
LVQEVLLVVFRKLPQFSRNGNFSFRSWLRTVTFNKVRDRWKSRAVNEPPISLLSEIEATENDQRDFEEREYQQYLVGRALRLMQADFQPVTWKACWELVVNERPAAAIALELGMSVGAVYAARFRVLTRLKLELDGLLE